MLRYPNMSIRLPQWISQAPVAPEASSFAGSTLRPSEGPAAREYIALATTSNVSAATVNPIATRVGMDALPMSTAVRLCSL